MNLNLDNFNDSSGILVAISLLSVGVLAFFFRKADKEKQKAQSDYKNLVERYLDQTTAESDKKEKTVESFYRQIDELKDSFRDQQIYWQSTIEKQEIKIEALENEIKALKLKYESKN